MHERKELAGQVALRHSLPSENAAGLGPSLCSTRHKKTMPNSESLAVTA